MERRNFFKTASNAAVFGIVGTKLKLGTDHQQSSGSSNLNSPSEILSSYTSADHRIRLENIAYASKRISGCLRKHLVTSYIPGHAVFAPSNLSWEPDDNDDQALAKLREIGIGIIQPWSGWATCWGKNYLIARNPDGFKRLVKLAQSHGLKVIPYTSSQFFERTDINFKSEWAWPKSFDLVESDYHLAHCSPASPEWRAYVLHRHLNVLDEYGVDGLYNDLGYLRPGDQADFYRPAEKKKFAEDDIIAFKEGPREDGALSDFLALIYAEVKRRGGIYKLHKEGIDTVYSDMKIYDYLWVGEATSDIDFVRESTKNYLPYVSPQRLITTSPEKENEAFLNSVPFMQFPIIGHGQEGKQDDNYITTFKYWFKLYYPMVEEGSWVWTDISSSDLFQKELPKNTVASLFVNRSVYLVIANYSNKPVNISTADSYISLTNSNNQPQTNWNINSRSMEILKLVNVAPD